MLDAYHAFFGASGTVQDAAGRAFPTLFSQEPKEVHARRRAARSLSAMHSRRHLVEKPRLLETPVKEKEQVFSDRHFRRGRDAPDHKVLLPDDPFTNASQPSGHCTVDAQLHRPSAALREFFDKKRARPD